MMKFICILAALAAALWGQSAPESRHLKDLKQLTNGGQNAEAYWAPDGKRLVFQSTRPPHQCDQIYVMNADGSDQRMVSTGKGRTTCAYFLADNKHIVYGSTHEAGPACPTPPDRSKGYVWAVFPGFDIYLADDQGAIKKKLTTAPGYDAEATVNFKTRKIVYTSVSSGDIELWQMNSDGSSKKQITRREGYDGGAVFSRDGKQIVWRATDPNNAASMARYRELLKENLTEPMKMEIFISDGDGKNVRQLTKFGCAAFAPTFTPDGKRIVFSSNKHNCDGRLFELYMMNTNGTGLEQLTNLGGFASFPEFSPDGKTLVFSSDYKASSRYEFNIFTAGWVD
ncbi:MAG: PD40 domain-containing protein [Bryobacteraceae bacterium]|nr:PD40 domain-containing protein [Bryobacteraceae bacterium]